MNARKLFAKAIENWPAKILSIVLAIILFVFYRMNTLEERFFSVPLNIERIGALMPSSSYPRMVRISLKGEANSIYPILEDDIEAYVNMERFVEPGVYRVPIQWRKKGTAQMVEPLQIAVDPVELTISLDHKISKFVPVVASFRGQVEMGHAMTSYTLVPAQAIIDGPAGLMVGISELYTDEVDLDGRRDDFSLLVNILNKDPLIVIRGNGTAEFRGNISRIIPVRNIGNVPIAIAGLREGFIGELEIKAGSIHLEGEDQAAIDRFETSPDILKVDCSGITEPGTYVLRVLSESASGVSLMVEPREVKIEIRLSQED